MLQNTHCGSCVCLLYHGSLSSQAISEKTHLSHTHCLVLDIDTSSFTLTSWALSPPVLSPDTHKQVVCTDTPHKRHDTEGTTGGALDGPAPPLLSPNDLPHAPHHFTSGGEGGVGGGLVWQATGEPCRY